jgi:hypothetical protein
VGAGVIVGSGVGGLSYRFLGLLRVPNNLKLPELGRWDILLQPTINKKHPTMITLDFIIFSNKTRNLNSTKNLIFFMLK